MSRAKRIAATLAPDVFRGLQPEDSISTVYLYADGHCLVAFNRYLKDVRRSVSYAKQAETIGLFVSIYDAEYERIREKGRVVFWGAGIPMLRSLLVAGATRIDCCPPTPREGKEPRPGSVDFTTPFGSVVLPRNDDCSTFVVDPEYSGEAFAPEATTWGESSMTIVETIRRAA